MRKDYIRYSEKSDQSAIGTFVLQTSGDAPLTGKSVDCSDFTWHSYQLSPVNGGTTYEGELFIEISNDGTNWHPFQSGSFASATEGSEIFMSARFLSKYARPVLTGDASAEYVISEVHRQ